MEMTFLYPRKKHQIKIWKRSQNGGRQNKKGSKLKLVIRPKSRHALPTFDHKGLFLAESILASLKWKDRYVFSCRYRKWHIPLNNTICQTSVQQNINKNKFYSLYCLTWCLCKEKNMESMHILLESTNVWQGLLHL